jgi:DNA-binding NtrC family response regulator
MVLSGRERLSAWRDQKWPGGSTRASRLNVLIVSDDAGLRAAAEQVLEDQGHGVTIAAHSGHALLACLDGGRIDAAVIDRILDDMPASDLADTLRRHHPDMRVLFFAEPGTRASAGVVTRPLAPDHLIAELEALTSPKAS